MNMQHVKLLRQLKSKQGQINGEPITTKFRQLMNLQSPQISTAQTSYNPQWPQLFQREQQRLLASAQQWLAGAIHHIGSSAIVGMDSKPIIDCCAKYQTESELDALETELLSLGYRGYGQGPIHSQTRWYWYCQPQQYYVLHLAPAELDCFAEALLFRDYLNANPAVRQQYQHYKQQLVAQQQDLFSYSVLKLDFYYQTLQQAVQWQSQLHSSTAGAAQ